jgi:ribose 5-phosphate isomerase B
MKIYFASDHAGFEMKGKLLEFVKELGFEVEDCGACELNPNDDYPEFIKKAAQGVSEDEISNPGNSRAIILGGSGQGEAIVANRFPNVRAVVFYGPASASPSSRATAGEKIVKLSREHNDANVLSLGARFLNIEEAKEAVKLWLETPFSNEERHIRRINKIEN